MVLDKSSAIGRCRLNAGISKTGRSWIIDLPYMALRKEAII
jgi:hypothetical protein